MSSCQIFCHTIFQHGLKGLKGLKGLTRIVKQGQHGKSLCFLDIEI